MFKKIRLYFLFIVLILGVISLILPTFIDPELVFYLLIFSSAQWNSGQTKTFDSEGPGPMFMASETEDIDDQMIVPYDM